MKAVAPSTYREKYAAAAGAAFHAAGHASPGWDAILAEDEELLWQGPSRPVLSLPRNWGYKALVGGLFIAVGLLAARAAGWWLVPSAALLALGVLLGVPAELREHWHQKRVFYSLSNRRGFKASTTFFGKRKLKTWPITPRTSFRLIKGNPSSIRFYEGRRESGRRPNYHSAFVAIEDATEVHKLLLRIQKDVA